MAVGAKKHYHEETMKLKQNREYKAGQIVVEDKVEELNRMSIDEIRETIARMLKGKKAF